jgi:hypothetical protein
MNDDESDVMAAASVWVQGLKKMVNALKEHRTVIAVRESEISARANIPQIEQKELEALKQAEVGYTILITSYAHECNLVLNKGLFEDAELYEVSADEKDLASKNTTNAFSNLELLDGVIREAKLLLVNLGLPTTIREFTDPAGNGCRIQIDLRSAKVEPQGYADSLKERYTYIFSELSNYGAPL